MFLAELCFRKQAGLESDYKAMQEAFLLPIFEGDLESFKKYMEYLEKDWLAIKIKDDGEIVIDEEWDIGQGEKRLPEDVPQEEKNIYIMWVEERKEVLGIKNS